MDWYRRWCCGLWCWCLFGGALGREKWVGFEYDARGTVGWFWSVFGRGGNGDAFGGRVGFVFEQVWWW